MCHISVSIFEVEPYYDNKLKTYAKLNKLIANIEKLDLLTLALFMLSKKYAKLILEFHD